jgi:alpha-beta hydrolase superfamily lysophospholipase
VEGKSEKEEIPPPVELKGNELLTSDGVALRATFYPGSKGKDSPAVILLHSSKGDRKEYATLAPFLQQRGCAVLVPDLRGFGESTQMTVGDRAKEIDGSKLKPADYEAMVSEDMETLKSFLVRQNDQGLLNVSKLCVVGAEMGASVAMYWANWDWHWPVLAGGRKQGQDVQGLVLLSPKLSFPGLPAHAALANPVLRQQISMLILVGKEERSLANDAKRIYKLVYRDQSELPAEKRDLFFGELETKLQGTKMLGVRGLNIEAVIARFIELRLVQPDYPWVKRKS